MTIRRILAVVVVLVFALLLFLPNILNALGFHRHYDIPAFDIKGKRALVITTSHDTLGDENNPTGVAASEMTIPYYAFLDAGLEVDLASIRGGTIPVDPITFRWPVATREDVRFKGDATAMKKLANSIPISEIDPRDYDVVFVAGGWGAAYDLVPSDKLADIITKAHANDAIIGTVCHGALALVRATKPDGSLLVEGRKVTGVTDKQLKDFGITHTPYHPETELRKANARFEASTAWMDFFATHVAVDGRLVTGQNQNSSGEASHRILELVAQK